ncbi:hypothetical protein [Paenibacillus sp. CF384]|uniref:hypothetical protein n=1 Tax=Paenibacillus sp. CF384 TaxID=1884382 RepID=UPI0008941CEF|nr:hypothetical protein [Paenibacillus sp. CF384]SDX73773.1 hypothetical protein SAMN05518855_102010 [Paenibacillus sp. CF384]
MEAFKSLLTKLLILLFTLLFIYPAIVFAMLVLGFTDSWKSGTVMLVSALLLRFILKREVAKLPPIRRMKQEQLGSFPGVYTNEESPPQLSDIYYDIAAKLREEEEIVRIVNQMKEKPGLK